MPKSRYRIMTDYMPKVGTRGLDMMYRTATAQANLDFASEADMVAKLRVGLALQPVMTALFANSPFTDGAPNGLSVGALGDLAPHRRRAHRHAAVRVRARHGVRALRRLRARRADVFRQARRRLSRRRRREFSRSDGRAGLPALPGERATISDWANHLSTIFPEVRLKRYLEMRGADVGPPERIVAQSALMVGLYYDAAALDGAGELIRGWSAQARQSAARRGAAAGACRRDRRPHGARRRARHAGAGARRPCAAGAARRAADATKRATSIRSTPSSRAGWSRRGSGWSDTPDAWGRHRSIRCSPKRASKARAA